MNKKQISEKLSLIAKFLTILNDNPFKIKAFENAARTIQQVENFGYLLENRELNKIKGVGKSIEQEIYKLIADEDSSLYKELINKIPEGLQEILTLKGLGAKKVKILYEDLGITTIGELEYACNENRLMLLKGFGKKTQENILKSIKKFKQRKMLLHYPDAELIVREIFNEIYSQKVAKQIAVTGDFRRKLEVIGVIDFVIVLEDKDNFKKKFGESKNLKIFDFYIEYVETEFFGKKVRFFIAEKDDFQKILFLTTGSEKFLENFETIKDFVTEPDFFKKNELNFIIPELREKHLLNIAPDKIINYNDIKGIFHIHTTYSDGSNSIEEIVKYLKKSGFKYAGISDHSKSAFYANGLNEDEIKRQHEEIDYLNEKYAPFKIFKGIESDILKDGSLDYKDSVLELFDFVIASVHSSFNLSEKDMTERIKRAIENPYTTILGHPTGRLILFRDSYRVDINKILEALSENDKFVEINSHPYRLDLSWENCIKASKLGIKFFINPDAHNLEGFKYLKYGINVARKAGLQREEILNSYELYKFTAQLS